MVSQGRTWPSAAEATTVIQQDKVGSKERILFFVTELADILLRIGKLGDQNICISACPFFK